MFFPCLDAFLKSWFSWSSSRSHLYHLLHHCHHHCSVMQSCPTLCDPMDWSTPGLPVLHHLPEFAQTHVHWGGDAIQSSHPLSSRLLLPSVFPSIKVFSNESALCIRWPKHGSFSFSISPSHEYSGLISFRVWLAPFTYYLYVLYKPSKVVKFWQTVLCFFYSFKAIYYFAFI